MKQPSNIRHQVGSKGSIDGIGNAKNIARWVKRSEDLGPHPRQAQGKKYAEHETISKDLNLPKAHDTGGKVHIHSTSAPPRCDYMPGVKRHT